MTNFIREKRPSDKTRDISFERNNGNAAGSVTGKFGNTIVLCTASIVPGVPRFLKERGVAKQGWLSAEYSMLPGATTKRNLRESSQGKQTGRSQEIQRLIGRSLRSCLDLNKLKDITIMIDCDVLQADGSTRTAAISTAYIAMVYAIWELQRRKAIKADPIVSQIAAVSVGIVAGEMLLDLDYAEDSIAETDMNIVATGKDEFIEIQGTAEQKTLTTQQLLELVNLANIGIAEILLKQQEALANSSVMQ